MTRMTGVIVAALFSVTAGMAESSDLFSDSVLVDPMPSSRHWNAVYTNAVPLTWQWEPTNAVRAVLQIDGMSGSVSTNFTVAASNWLWQVSETAVPAEDDVYRLILSFYDAGDSNIGAMTSRLAVVKGSFGAVSVDSVAESRTWARVTGNAVIPYDASWSQATLTNALSAVFSIGKPDGTVQTNRYADTAGYAAWNVRDGEWGYGTFALSMRFDGATNEWTAALTRLRSGTLVSLK